MLLNSLAVRYAQALFSLAQKTGRLDEMMTDLIKVREIFSASETLSRAVESPTIPVETKKSILKQLLASRVSADTLHFFYVLVDKNRQLYLNSIIESYQELLRNERGEIAVTVQTATPLSEAVIAQVKSTMTQRTGKKVELKTEVVPELLGGMVIFLGDRIIDGSVKHQMSQIQERLTKTGVATVG